MTIFANKNKYIFASLCFSFLLKLIINSKMDNSVPLNYYPDLSKNYIRQQAPLTNQFIYDNLSDNYRGMTPRSQDISHQVTEQNNELKRQLNEEMGKRNYLMEEIKNLEYQNNEMRNNQNNQTNSYKKNSLRSEN